jgi:hypothetical protein
LDLLEETLPWVELAFNGGEINCDIEREKRDEDFIFIGENIGPGVSDINIAKRDGGYRYPEQRTFLPLSLAYLTIF